MSRRGILNITSKKKQDNMRPIFIDSNGLPNDNPYSLTQDGSNAAIVSIFCPTYRIYEGQMKPSQLTIASRQSDIIYWRGIREHVRVTLGGDATWKWRRIVYESVDSPTTNNPVFLRQNTPGYRRVVNLMNNDARTGIFDYLFAGSVVNDWIDPTCAKVDRRRVKILHDSLYTLRGITSGGTSKDVKFWIPLNKSMTYENDENGADEFTAGGFCAPHSKLGDVYIVDILIRMAGDPASRISIVPQSTAYWHER